MSRVVHFEISVADPPRAVSFYQHVFGWEIREWDGPSEYWLVITGDDDTVGINGGFVHRENSIAGSVNLIDVPSLDHALVRVVEADGTIIHSRSTVQGVGYVAYCRDTEGNAFGLIELDETAS
ncbi:MAG: VOC family protein [Candidatus Latescibacterota bacterium]|nr:VOC family protein [Candidatus Latescibacterota bacterium]